MNNQSLSLRLVAGFSLMVMLSACGKNMSIGVTDEQLAKLQNKEQDQKNGKTGTGSDTSTATGSSTETDTSTETGTSTDTNASTSTSVDAKSELAELNVVQPISLADFKVIQEKNISMDRLDRAEQERKTSRLLFKILPQELMVGEASIEKPVLNKKGKPVIDRKTKKPKTTLVKGTAEGALSMVLVIDRQKSGLTDYSNLKVCLFKDIRNDECRADSDIVQKGAYIHSNDPNLVKIDLIKAFDLKVETLFKGTSAIMVKNEKGEMVPSQFFRKLLLSYEGLKTLEGAILEASSGTIAGKAEPTGYNEAKLVGQSEDDLISSKVN